MDEKFIKFITEINSDIVDNPEANLIDDGIIDSLNIMQIITGFETQYGIEFDPEDLVPENFETLNVIWNLLQKYLNQHN